MRINLKKAERVVLEEGPYALEVKQVEPGESKKGKPKMDLQLTPSAESHPELADVNCLLFHSMSLQEQSWYRVLYLLKAAFGEDKVVAQDDDGNFDFDEQDLVGAVVAAWVSVDKEYDGTPRNKIDNFYPLEQLEALQKGGRAAVESEGEAQD